MAEFILVKYPRRRTVFVDGADAGFTNTILRIGNAGFHDVELSPPKNYTPPSFDQVLIRNTSVNAPKEFTFTPVSQAPAGEGGGGEA